MLDSKLNPKAQALTILRDAFQRSFLAGEIHTENIPKFSVQRPQKKEHGDLATNLALVLSAQEHSSPRSTAGILVKNLADPEGVFSAVWVAGPGFINLRFSKAFWLRVLLSFADRGPAALIPDSGAGEKVVVEFVSANPTGPLHVGHGRGAAVGDAIASILASTGHRVTRQYYVNDAGNQVEALGKSILFRMEELRGKQAVPPQDYYPGEYIIEIAKRLSRETGDQFPVQADPDVLLKLQSEGVHCILEEIKRDLADFGVRYDEFVSERELVGTGRVRRVIEKLRAGNFLYEDKGALWFRSQPFGDEKDRPMVKADGTLTYLASDVALHDLKFENGSDELVNIWGADHHGYVARLKGAMAALGHPSDRLRVVLVQMVNLTRGGVPVRMGKRSGEFVTLREVLDEVGVDAARFFFLMRKSDTQLEFDLELAKSQTAENPVFYVQYAHSRISSILAQATLRGIEPLDPRHIVLERLDLDEELALVALVARFPEIVEEAAAELEPHRIVFYLMELAADFHRYYNRQQVLGPDAGLTQARLLLVQVIQRVLSAGLRLLGVSTPDRM